jgi:uncharacterized protein (DUF1697 family)
MSRFAAFLRGMNVGGHRLTNEELRGHFESLGFEDVATFRASGNVVFAAGEQTPQAVTRRIEQGLGELLGYAVPTFVRSDAQVHAIAAHEPFPPERVRASAGKLQVSLLASAPSAHVREQTLAMASEHDLLAIRGRELYWLPSGGLLDSPLDLDEIDRMLGASTRRTKGTLEQLARKHLQPRRSRAQ